MYKAHLTHWHGEGPTKTVAVKTLKGTISDEICIIMHMMLFRGA